MMPNSRENRDLLGMPGLPLAAGKHRASILGVLLALAESAQLQQVGQRRIN